MAKKRTNWYTEADKAADRHKIPRYIFRALVGAESSWDQEAKSPVGALGFTQLMPKTAAGLGVDPTDPFQNLEGGARYLRQQLDRFGNMRLALAAYNAGPGNVESGDWLTFKETTRYVKKIMSATPTAPQAKQAKPNKQQSTTTPVAFSAPPPVADLAGPSPMADPTQLALDGLTAIGQGQSPVRTLARMVDTMVRTPPPTRQQVKVQQPELPVPTASLGLDKPEAGQPTPAAPKPGGGWGGSFSLAKGFADIASRHGLKAISEKRDTKATKTGGVSDHWTGSKDAYAFDLSNTGNERTSDEQDAAAVEIAAALGVKYDGKSPLVLTTKVNGYRVQVLYRTQVGGDHDGHIHLGVRKA